MPITRLITKSADKARNSQGPPALYKRALPPFRSRGRSQAMRHAAKNTFTSGKFGRARWNPTKRTSVKIFRAHGNGAKQHSE